MTTHIKVALVTTATLGALAVTTLASEPQQGRDVRPTTSSVDFIVVARDGQPVTDLKPEEVTLRVGNKTRVIKTLQFVKVAESMVGAVGGAAAGAPAGEPVTPAFATNIATVAETPRSIVLMVDDESIPPNQEKKLQEALNNFLRDLPPTDQVALATVPHGGIKVGFTTDRDRLRREIANISPIQPVSLPPCQTLTMLGTIETTITQLTKTTDQPVTVALLSVSLTGASQAERSQLGGGVSAQAGACHIVADDFVRIGHAVAATRAQLYIIHPDFSIAPAADGIANLRGQTGAPLFHLQSNTEPGLSRMARETSGYYLATFDPEPEDRPGAPQTSSIKTTREGVEVRGRPFTVVGRGANAAATTLATVPAVTMTAWDMVRSGKMFRDLPMRGTATPFRNDDGSINVVGLFEPIDPTVKIVSAAAALVDESGQGRAVWEGEADKMTSWPVAIGLHLKGEPGKYRLRVAAIDSNGRMGLIDDTMMVQIYPTGGPITISGLMLGVTDSSGGALKPRMAFSKEDSATAYVEMYGASDGVEAGAMFEVARTLNGPAFLTLRGTFAATSVDGKFGVTAKIPLAALAPGDYVVRAIVGTAKQATRVVRTLRKTG